MYEITKLISGNYEAICYVQDGKECKIYPKKDEAVKWLITSAKMNNNDVITDSFISYYQEVSKTYVARDRVNNL